MKNIIILGAAGRDFHNFNVHFKNNPDYKVVAFTTTQITKSEERIYPVQLSGRKYPYGIPIMSENDLPFLIKRFNVDQCVFSYSDIAYDKMMSLASIVQAAGVDFLMLGTKNTMLNCLKPLIAICGTRSECGKGKASLKIVEYLKSKGKKVIVIRHPMPNGVLKDQIVQRFATLDDIKKHKCSIEEAEEYIPHIENGNIVYAGVDYHDVLRAVEDDKYNSDIIVWEGGSNDFPFYDPDLMITLADPHHVGYEKSFYPGELNIRLSDVVLINKVDTACGKDIIKMRKNILDINPKVQIIEAASPIEVDNPSIIQNKKVLVIEEETNLIEGHNKTNAGTMAAQKYGAAEIISPLAYAVGTIAETYKKYPECSNILPVAGYTKELLSEIEKTINNTPCDTLIIATRVDLSRHINIKKPVAKVHNTLYDYGKINLSSVLDDFIARHFEE